MRTTENRPAESPRPAVGFYMAMNAERAESERAWRARKRCLRHFPWLHEQTLSRGETRIAVWSHRAPGDAIHVHEDGSLFILCGSPMNDVTWRDALEKLARQGDDHYELPWEGRCVLIRVSPDGRGWTIWNDWVGALPVFHARLRNGAVVSSIEPIVVEAAGLSSREPCPRGMVELLVHGHFVGTDTLYEQMQALPADSVSRWENGRYAGSKTLWTVEPSDSRWDWGWEALAEGMHHQTYRAVSSALSEDDRWILPLSGGLDSRVIACVGADEGVSFEAYTYGPATWNDAIYARQVARVLGIPWQRVDVGVDYLRDHTPMWLDWFGSSLHAHGMYQMPFLLAVRGSGARIVNGFMGDALAGHHLNQMMAPHPEGRDRLRGGLYSFWAPDELGSLLHCDVRPYLEEIQELLRAEFDSLRGAPFQRQQLMDFRNSERRFISYQTAMYDHWNRVSTPYMDREYARFCLSLPRLALDDRALQKRMLERYWPQVAEIGGTFCSLFPEKLSKRWLLRAGIASLLPTSLRVGPLREFGPCPNNMQADAVRTHGWGALYPLSPEVDGGDILNAELVVRTVEHAIRDGDSPAYSKVRVLQPLIYRLMDRGRRDVGS